MYALTGGCLRHFVYNQPMTAYIRKVESKSCATSVQIEYKRGRERTGIVHIVTAHNDAELKLLCALAQEKIHAGQLSFNFGPPEQSGRRHGFRGCIRDCCTIR